MSEKPDERAMTLQLLEESKRIRGVNKFICYAIADELCSVFAKTKQGIHNLLIENEEVQNSNDIDKTIKRVYNLTEAKGGIQNMYKIAIFDLDGTILDTLDDLADSANHALEYAGFPTRTKNEICSFVGNGIHKLIEKAVPQHTSSDDIEDVFTEFVSYYKVHCTDKTMPYYGITEMLKKLKKHGIKTAVVSNKADFATKELCNRYFPSMLDVTIGQREGVAIKPAPDTVNEVLHLLGMTNKDAVYIGDSDVDIMTAKNAKMNCISVSWGFRNKDFLIKNNAEAIVSDVCELEKLIMQGYLE